MQPALSFGRLSGSQTRLLRKLWTARTLVDADAGSLSTKAERYLASNSGDALVLAVSKNLPASDLSKIVSLFQTADCKHKIGCLTEQSAKDYSCSIALWKPSQSTDTCVSFRSDIQGRPKIAVGREIRPEIMDQREQPNMLDSSTSWQTMFEHNSHQAPQDLPSGLRNAKPSQILYFTDDRPEGLIKCLLHAFKDISKVGAIASSTPFVTGRPFTLLHNDQIHSDGAVGLSITESSLAAKPAARYPGWQTVGLPMKISSVKGNIIATLDDESATKVLLQHLQSQAAKTATHIDKEDQYFLGILPSGADLKRACLPEEANSIFHIGSGDPKRGSMALDTESSLIKGSYGQFYIPTTNAMSLDVTEENTFQFHVARSGRSYYAAEGDTFAAATEHGVIMDGDEGKTWINAVPGSCVSMR